MAKRNFIRLQSALILMLLAMMACIVGSEPTSTPNTSQTQTVIAMRDSVAATKDAVVSLTEEAAEPFLPTLTPEPLPVELDAGLAPRPDFDFDPCSLLAEDEIELIIGQLVNEPLPEAIVELDERDSGIPYKCSYLSTDSLFEVHLTWLSTELEALKLFNQIEWDRVAQGHFHREFLSDKQFWSNSGADTNTTLFVSRYENVVLELFILPRPLGKQRILIEELAEQILLNVVGIPQE